MNIGISTACFYPQKTEEALALLGKYDINVAEIFINSFNELSTEFLTKLQHISTENQIRISSIHPFTCCIEGLLFFSDYERRFYDGLKIYESYSKAAQFLGAKILVMHGDMYHNKLSIKEIAERYIILSDICSKYGVTLTLENVVKFASESVDYIRKLLKLCGGKLKLTFDIKQSIRSKVDPFLFIDEFGQDIVHLHISDNNMESDCLPPGEGIFDFEKFISKLSEIRYGGDAIIELYSKNFSTIDQLKQSINFLKSC